jgi:hypothetical protein
MKKTVIFLAVSALCMAKVAWADNINVGDEVELQNPEFDDDSKGWTNQGRIYTPTVSIPAYMDNRIGVQAETGQCSMQQTVSSLPNGLYLLQVNAFDMVRRNSAQANALHAQTDTVATYLFVNDQQVLLKTVFDDALTGQNIYRWYRGLGTNDNYFTDEAATCCMPLAYDNPAGIALMANPYLYQNCAIGVVTDGTLTVGLRKTDRDRETNIYFDHFKVTYLSASTSLQEYADKLKDKPMSQQARSALLSASGSRLANAVGRAETSARLFAAIRQIELTFNAPLMTDNEAMNYYLALCDEQERQATEMLDITVEQPGTLCDEIFDKMGDSFNLPDLKRLRIKGQLNEADLIALRDRCSGLVELDMSSMLNTTFVESQFANHYYLRYVTLPDYTEELPYRAFYQCYNLNNVAFPATMKTVGSGAFECCYNMRQVVLPEGVTKIGESSFSRTGLRQVVLPSTLDVVPFYAFQYAYELTDLQFKGQTTIKDNTFGSCNHLKVLKMPSSMVSIGGHAFEYCSRLEDVRLNEGLVEMWGGAFANCSALKQITLPSSVQGLYSEPFAYCDSLLHITCLSVAPPFTQAVMTGSSSRNNPFGERERDKGHDVSVPYISQNVYKQTDGWAFHNIVPHDMLPKDVYINTSYNMTWPADLMATWKPNIHITPNAKDTWSHGFNLTYGSLYVGSKASFSADTLSTYYGFYVAKENDNRRFFTQMLTNGTGRADHIVTEINIAKDYWTFISVPYDVKVSEITSTRPDDPFVIRTYDGKKRAEGKNTEAWVKMTKDSILHAGQGYIIRTTNDEWGQNCNNFFLPSMNNANKLKYFTNDDVVVPLANYPTEFAHNRSWNFIGNPYPCFFDIRAMQTTSPITIWNRSSKYETYSPLDDDYILNPGQAFFIQRPLDQSQVIFLKEGRQQNLTVRDTIYYNSSRAKVAGTQRQVFNIYLATDDEMADRTRFVINEGATLSYDAGLDASKFFSTEPGVAHLYTLDDDVQYAINERPVGNGEIRLGLQVPANDTYTISLQTTDNRLQTLDESHALWLIDHETGAETDLTAAAYTFQGVAGTQNDRFVIRLGGAINGVTEIVNGKSSNSKWYDLQGRRVSEPQKGIYVKDHKKVVIK